MSETRTIGPYRLLVKLGAGAMGEVWRALDTRLDRSVAIKLLPSALAGDPDRRARMLREAKAAAAVPHANVVTLFDIGSEGGEDYLVMELVEGRTVADRLREGRPPLKEALELSIGVAAALAAAHKRGILHRDVKAANVMVTRDGGVKVLDFGLAKLRAAAVTGTAAAAAGVAPSAPPESGRPRPSGALDATLPSQGGSIDATRDGTMLGTPAYFSPEQVQGKLPDERSEIFSLGVLVYELIAGSTPFAAETFEELCAVILACRPPVLDAPEPLRAVVRRGLAFEPGDRYADMAEFAADLRRVRDQLFAPPRRRRWPWVVLAAVLIVGGIAGTAVYMARHVTQLSEIDKKIEQAVAEYDVFYNDKAVSSLKTAMRLAPADPRPYAYLVLMGFGDDAELATAAKEAEARIGNVRRNRDRVLVHAAVALVREGPAAARATLGASGEDRELAFWNAEFAWKAGQFDQAMTGYAELMATPTKRFRGRIFDHYLACLLYRDRVAEAVSVVDTYVAEFPGEADPLGTQATVYAAAGRLDEALALAQEAVSLNQNEDTLAGLAKVRASRGELIEAAKLYEKAIVLAPDYRRPLRRAALAYVLLLSDRGEATRVRARATIADCLPGAAEANARTVSICLFIAGLVDPSLVAVVVPELRKRATVEPPGVPYGRPEALAAVLEGTRYEGMDDLYLGYHVPFGSSLIARLRSSRGDPRGALPALQAAVTARPADVPALVELAAAQFQQSMIPAARDTLRRAFAVWPSSADRSDVLERAEALRVLLANQ